MSAVGMAGPPESSPTPGLMSCRDHCYSPVDDCRRFSSPRFVASEVAIGTPNSMWLVARVASNHGGKTMASSSM
jgi:hypothetical protein